MEFQLKTATEYTFRARACSELTKLCWNWSANVTGTTSDGNATAPTNIQVTCKHNNILGRTVVSAKWDAPLNPNGVITHYHVVLDGIATYKYGTGIRNETYGPKARSVPDKSKGAEYENVPYNTNYTVHVSAITRSKHRGASANGSCSMPRSIPPNKDVNELFWSNFRAEDRYMIRLFMPKISERSGPICGYRVYLVRMPQTEGLEIKDLPAAHELEISTYHEVHAANNTKGGAYIAETLSTDIYQNEIFLGDNIRLKDNAKSAAFANVNNENCRRLLNGYIERRAAQGHPTLTIKGSSDDSLLDGRQNFRIHF